MEQTRPVGPAAVAVDRDSRSLAAAEAALLALPDGAQRSRSAPPDGPMGEAWRRRPGSLPVMMRHPEEPSHERRKGSCGGTSRVPEGQSYVPHAGGRQRLREHVRAWRAWEALCAEDTWARTTRERLLDFVSRAYRDEVQEAAAMSLVLGARCVAAERSVTWTAALNQMLNELEDKLPVDGTRMVV